MVTKSQTEEKSGKGTDTSQATISIEAATQTITQKAPGLLSEIDTTLHDIFFDINTDSSPVQEISVSFEQAFLAYTQMSEKEFLEEIKEALKDTGEQDNNFLNLEFEDLFAVQLEEGGSDAGRAISAGSEGSVNSLERILGVNNAFDRLDENDEYKVLSQPQTLVFETVQSYPYAVAPTQTPNLTENGPRAPSQFIPPSQNGEQLTISETILNTQNSFSINGNVFVASEFNNFSPASKGAGLFAMDVFFAVPARAGSTEIHTASFTTLTTPEGNTFYFDRVTGAYTYTLNNAILHLQSVWGPNYVDITQEIFTDRFQYAITDISLQTAVGNISVFIGDDHPVATNQIADTITEASIQTTGSYQSMVPAVLTDSLISAPNNIFGADGGIVSNVTLVGGSTSIGGGFITVTDTAGNTLVVNQVTGGYDYNLTNPFNNSVVEPTVLVYTFTFTDADLDTVTKTLTLTILDDAPVGNIVLKAGVIVATDETPGIQAPESAVPAGTLGQTTVLHANLVTDTTLIGADGPGSRVYTLSITAEGIASGFLTPNGSQNIVLHDNGGVIEGRVGNTAGALAFTVSVNASGDVTLTQYLAVQHSPDSGNNQLSSGMTAGVLILTETVSDNDGDSIAPTVDLGSVIKFYDDGPSGTIVLKAGVDVATDETPGVQGPDTANVGLGQTTVTYASLITDTTIYGSDGAGTKVFSLVAVDGTASGYKTPDGSQDILLFNNGAVIEGRVGTTVMFSVSVNSSTGDVTLTQYFAVQHTPDSGNDQLSNGMTTGVLSLQSTVTDADGDVITPTVDLGSRVKFFDDGPSGTIALKAGADVATDETPGVQGPDTANVGLGQTTVLYSTLISDSTIYGSDGAGTSVYSLVAVNGTASGYKTPDGSQNIVLFNNGGVIEGHVGTTVGALAFTVSVNSSTGDVTLTQYLAVQHTPDSGNNQLSSGMTANVLSLKSTVTDADGDVITPTVDLGSRIKFYDDGPSGAIALKAGVDVATDETAGVQGPDDAAVGLGQNTVLYASLITDTTIYGSDGAGTKVFSLVATDGADSGFNNSNGTQNIYLFNNGSVIEGRVANSAGALVFTVSVNSSTGDVTLTQYQAVQHGNSLDPNDIANMDPGVLALKATVTDADGDVITPTVDLGSVIKFYDDGPSGTIALKAGVDVATDETPGVQAPDDAAVGLGQNTVLYASLITDTTIYGSDGAGTRVFSLVAVDGTASGYKTPDGSQDILLFNNGAVVEGRVGTTVMFSVSVNSSTGDVTLTQYFAVQHTPDSGNDQLSNGMTANVLGLRSTVTDADGDIITPTVDLGSRVKFYDDGPSGTIALKAGVDVATDETPGVQGPDDAAVGLGQNTVLYSSLVTDTTIYGSDGAGTRVFSLVTVNGTDSGFNTPDGLTNILLFNNSGVIEGHAGTLITDPLVFTVSVNASTGDVTLTQYLAVQHSNPNDPNELSSGMLAGALRLTETVTDADGDIITPTVDLGSRIKFIDDGPSSVIALKAGVDVATDETAGQQGPDTANVGLGQTTVTYASLITDATTYGSDGAGTKVFSLVAVNGTDSGFNTPDGLTNILLFNNGGIVEGHAGTLITDPLVFTVSVNSSTGDVTLTQYLAVEHTPDSGNNQLSSGMTANTLSLKSTVTDADGDNTTSTVDLGSRVKFYDDGPSGTIALKAGVDVATDETPGVQGPDDSAGGLILGQNTVSYASLVTDTTIYGSDGAGTKVFSLVAVNGTDSGFNTPDGLTNILLFNNGGVVEGHAGTLITDPLVFTVSVNASTGDVTLTQYLAVEHSNPNDPNELSSGMLAGALRLTETVTDADGDIITPTVDLGSRIKFFDDGPSSVIALKAGVDVATDETVGQQGPDTANVGLGQTTVTYVSLITDATIYGSDGAGTKVFSLVAVNGTDSGFNTPDGLTNILLFNNGGVIEGHAGTLITDPLVFTVSVNSSTGDVTLTQYLAVEHTPDSGNNQLSSGMTANALSLKSTVTDADGDNTTSTVDLGSRVKFYDDGPSGTIALKAGVDVATDETAGQQPTETSAPIGTLGQTIVTYATLINDTTIYGSDGAGAKVFNLVATEGADSGYKTPDGSTSILLYNVAGVVEGHAGLVTDPLVFDVSVNSSTGDVTLTQYLAIEHSNPNDPNELSSGMLAGVLTLTATVTDADGDVITPIVDLSSVIKFYDDGATADNVTQSGNEDAASITLTLTGSSSDEIANFRIDLLPSDSDGNLFIDSALTIPVIEGDLISAVGNSATLYFVPNADFNGNVIFDYVAIDNDGDSDTAQVDITVNPLNDAPTAQSGSLPATTEDGPPIVGFFLGDDIDSDDDGSTLIFSFTSASSIPVSVLAGLTTTANGFTYDPSTDFQFLAVDEQAQVFINYKATDSHGADSAIATYTLTITGVNDSPIAADDSYSDPLLNIITRTNLTGLLSNDTDPDTTDSLLVTQINNSALLVGVVLTHGVLNVGSDGSFTYTSDGSGIADKFTYTVSDGHGGTDIGDVTIVTPGVPPMILDLNNNNKIDLIDADKSSVTLNSFDDTTGTNPMGWVKPGDGILVYDYQGDGKISNIDEIALTLHSEQAKTDLDALRIAFDTNHDGIFDAKDAEFSKFGVWQDKNSDGISDVGEYHTLTQMGILSINVNSDHQVQMIEGNTVHGFSSYQTADGASHLIADVSLSVAPATKSVAISEPDVIGDHSAIDFSSIASLAPLASENPVQLTSAPAPLPELVDFATSAAIDIQHITQQLVTSTEQLQP